MMDGLGSTKVSHKLCPYKIHLFFAEVMVQDHYGYCIVCTSKYNMHNLLAFGNSVLPYGRIFSDTQLNKLYLIHTIEQQILQP